MRRMFLAKKTQGDIPSGYTQIQWIESDASSWIDSGIVLSLQTGVLLDLELIGGYAATTPCIFGCRDGASKNSTMAQVNSSQSTVATKLTVDFNNSVYSNFRLNTVLSYATNNRFAVSVNRYARQIINKFGYVEESNNTICNDVFSASKTIYIFACNGYGSPCKMRHYNSKIYDGEDIVRDFVPVIRDFDDAVGLYDVVGKRFYANEGTGTFLAGPEV